MRPTLPRSFRAHADLLRLQFLQGTGLPFADVLTEDLLAGALAAVCRWLDRIFSPWSPSGCSWDRCSTRTTHAGPPSPG
jgi:hypothetical protein